MATVRLLIDDPATRYTLKAMLEAEGYRVASEEGEVVIAEDIKAAVNAARDRPTLVLASATQIPEAVGAMKQGVYGYVFMPLQPGEAPLMVDRALAATRAEVAEKPAEPTVDVATLEEVERRHILNVLRLSKFNQAKAARALGIGRNTLWRKLKQYEAREQEHSD